MKEIIQHRRCLWAGESDLGNFTTIWPQFINGRHEAKGYEDRTHIRDFGIFSMESIGPFTKPFISPYRQELFQISLLNNTGKGTIDLDTNRSNLGGLSLGL